MSTDTKSEPVENENNQRDLLIKLLQNNKTTKQKRSDYKPTGNLDNTDVIKRRSRHTAGKTIRKNYSLSEVLADAIATKAEEKGISASRFIEETMTEKLAELSLQDD